jgi:hypothetical protein
MKIAIKEFKSIEENEHGWIEYGKIKKDNLVLFHALGIGANAPFYRHVEVYYKNSNIATLTLGFYTSRRQIVKIINDIIKDL